MRRSITGRGIARPAPGHSGGKTVGAPIGSRPTRRSGIFPDALFPEPDTVDRGISACRQRTVHRIKSHERPVELLAAHHGPLVLAERVRGLAPVVEKPDARRERKSEAGALRRYIRRTPVSDRRELRVRPDNPTAGPHRQRPRRTLPSFRFRGGVRRTTTVPAVKWIGNRRLR